MVCVSHKVDGGDRNRKCSGAANTGDPCAAGQGNWTRFGVSVPVAGLHGRGDESPPSCVRCPNLIVAVCRCSADGRMLHGILFGPVVLEPKRRQRYYRGGVIRGLREILVYRFFIRKNKGQNGINGTDAVQAGHKQEHHLGDGGDIGYAVAPLL